MRIASGVTDQVIFFVAVDATDLKTREPALDTFTVYRSRNGGTATVMTTPTVAELDATNMTGVYSLLLDEDMDIDAGDETQEMCFHITHAGMAPVTRTIELYRPKITAGNTLGVESDGDLTKVNTLDGHTAQTGDSFARLGAPAGASVSADIAAVEAQTDDIGAAGAGLTAVPWNAAWDAEVESEVADALAAYDPPTAAELTAEIDSVQADIAALNDPTAAAIADAVWDEAKAGHVAAGSFGDEVQAHALSSEVAAVQADTDDIQTRLPAALVAGRMSSDAVAISGSTAAADGVEANIANLDAAITTRATPAQVATELATYDGPTHTELIAEIDDVQADIATRAAAADTAKVIRKATAQAGGATSITLDASASATDDLYNRCRINLTGGTGAGQSNIITDYNGTTKVATVDATWATNPDATTTFEIVGFGALLFDPAGDTVTLAAATHTGAVIPTVTAVTNGVSLATDAVSAAAVAADGAQEIADALLDRADAIETGWTLRKILRVIASACCGKLSGAATATNVVRSVTDGKDRITATVDGDGNRSAVTLDGD